MGTSCPATTGAAKPECTACAHDPSDLMRWACCVDRMVSDLDPAAEHHPTAAAYAFGARKVLGELTAALEAAAAR